MTAPDVARDPYQPDGVWLTTAGAAARFGISRRTVRRWIQLGHLEAARLGRGYVRVRLPLEAKPTDTNQGERHEC